MHNNGNRSGSTYITMKQRCLKYSIKDHIYIMPEKRNLHNQALKMHKNPRKVLSEGHTQANSQIHKNIQKRKLFRRISGKIWIIGFTKKPKIPKPKKPKKPKPKKPKIPKKNNFPGLLEKPHRDFLRVQENCFFWCFWFFFFFFFFFCFFWFWFFCFFGSGFLVFLVLVFLVFLLSRVCDFCCILVYALGNTLYCTPSLLAVQLGDLRQGEKG